VLSRLSNVCANTYLSRPFDHGCENKTSTLKKGDTLEDHDDRLWAVVYIFWEVILRYTIQENISTNQGARMEPTCPTWWSRVQLTYQLSTYRARMISVIFMYNAIWHINEDFSINVNILLIAIRVYTTSVVNLPLSDEDLLRYCKHTVIRIARSFSWIRFFPRRSAVIPVCSEWVIVGNIFGCKLSYLWIEYLNYIGVKRSLTSSPLLWTVRMGSY